MSKVWLITGASRGLGRAFTEEALKAGHRVVATARNSEQLAEVAARFGGSVRAVSLDVTKEAQAKYAVNAAIQTFGGAGYMANSLRSLPVAIIRRASCRLFLLHKTSLQEADVDHSLTHPMIIVRFWMSTWPLWMPCF